MSRHISTWAEMFASAAEAAKDETPIESWAAQGDWTDEMRWGDVPTPEPLRGTGTPSAPWWTTVFDAGYGSTHGCPFTVWTSARVYFPICYDGAEWVGSAPRNPCAEALAHQGGG